MTVLAAVMVTLFVLLAVVNVAGLVVYRRRELERAADRVIEDVSADRLLGALYVEKVILTLHSGESFTGLLGDLDEKSILLHQAEAFLDGRKIPVDGELLIPRADVRYYQKP